VLLCCKLSGVNIVVPYRAEYLAPELKEILPLHARFIEMAHDFSYARLLKTLVAIQRPVILVEHDILPTPEQLEELWACPFPWCAHAYAPFEKRDYNETPATVVGFGLCKLGAPLLEMMQVVPFPSARWDHCDFIFTAFARQFGFTVHQHRGDVRHLLTRHGGHYP
jgi:hypothetical protein